MHRLTLPRYYGSRHTGISSHLGLMRTLKLLRGAIGEVYLKCEPMDGSIDTSSVMRVRGTDKDDHGRPGLGLSACGPAKLDSSGDLVPSSSVYRGYEYLLL